MILVRSPLRISIFGSSIDYYDYFSKFGARTIGLAIDKYTYVCIRRTPAFFPYKTKVIYSELEEVQDNMDVKNRAVLGAFKYLNFKDGVEISYQCDVNKQSGLATSSSFIASLVKGLGYLQGRNISGYELADAVNYIERVILEEKGGMGDPPNLILETNHIHSVSFQTNGYYSVDPLPIDNRFTEKFLSYCSLVYVGSDRNSFEIANHAESTVSLKRSMHAISDQAYTAFLNKDIGELGRLLDICWQEKRKISGVSNEKIDSVYQQLKSYGVIGCKLCGSGGSGFFFTINDEPNKKLPNSIPFKLAESGPRIKHLS